ncbi:aldehyde dehydrogenase [Aspergillus homomorphus CBS 101889]|uniref:aldehyde dehydrogenase (NAD(+)) n=1 Tax=Aspergillus homomorphus (strain CBS 101889) TaxID=1450537 RepID=A0A395HSZ5_ASPHC|nr:aldehyde dehydrogenase [Aspergillus homomorphus CBS 101889]RAL09968.1 aldehyde dehydrogenase [Aspergillus homomorphus CBS 101889]
MNGPSKETPEYQLLIDGRFQLSSHGKIFELNSPYTDEKVADVYEANETDVDEAVAAAKAAFPAWRDLSPADRGEEFARLEALSTGKPVSRNFDSSIAIETFNYFAEAGWTVQGSSSRNTPGYLNITVKEPYGVVAAIIPWNLPLAFFAMKIAPAVAAGNTIVLKSREKSPLTIGLGAKLIVEAGFPPGVVNILHGYGPTTGNAIASHMDIRCISFTGSSLTGRKIQAAAAKGKTPAIIFDDADLESAAAQTQFSVQLFSGQTCIANSRIYVHETVAERFLGLFKERYGAAVLGDPLNTSTDQGPHADRVQYERVRAYLAIGEKEGLKRTLGGDAKDGNFIRPTVFAKVPEDSQIMKEEVFGPVVVIKTFSKEEEVIKKANNGESGLYASVFTKNIDRAGFKGSGIGREGYLHSLDSYLETKAILIKTR